MSVALGAGVATAATVWIYGDYARTQYEASSVEFVQLARDVPKYKTIQTEDLRGVRIPGLLLEAFRQAVKADDKYALLVDRPAPRYLFKGDFVFYHDLFPRDTAFPAPEGHEFVTLPVHPINAPLEDLALGVYTLYGEFDVDTDPEKIQIEVFPVIKAMNQLGLIGCDTITVSLPEKMIPQLLEIQRLLQSGRFFITVSHWSVEGPDEPEINEEVLRLLQKGSIDRPLNRPDDRPVRKRQEA